MKPNEPISNIIPEEVVEAVCQEIEGSPPNHVRQYIMEILDSQPALYGFVAPFCQDLSPHAERLVGFILAAMIRMFQIHFGKRLQSVSPMPLETLFKKNAALFDRLLDPDEDVSNRAATELRKEQPWVWKYVARCVMKSDHSDLGLGGEDREDLALVMKTVMDALNSSVRPTRVH